MQKHKIKLFINRILKKSGYQISRVGNPEVNGKNIFNWLDSILNIKTIIDIGANDGEFGHFLFKYFGAQKIYAFEPLPFCVPLVEKCYKNSSHLNLYNIALSNYEGEEILYQNSYPPASSLLRVSKISKTEFPQTNGEKPIKTKVKTLDSILGNIKLEKDILIKIDVQGVEDKVIKGGEKIFAQANAVLIEMSFVTIYEKQPIFDEINTLLVNSGFRFMGLKNQISSENTGQPLFAHCLYLKK